MNVLKSFGIVTNIRDGWHANTEPHPLMTISALESRCRHKKGAPKKPRRPKIKVELVEATP
jgi:hypothetical protein